MIARKIKKGELRRTFEIANIAFEASIFDLDVKDPIEDTLLSNAKDRFDLYCMERWASFLDDDHTMLGSFIAIPYEVYFDGNICLMRGVGAVSTLPQYRGLKAMENCMSKYLNDSYNAGDIFSSLFPFSRHFYQKFGYEFGSNVVFYSIDLRSIKKLPKENKGTVEICICENDINMLDFKKVYIEYRNSYNLSTYRKDIDFKFLYDINSKKQKRYIYLYKNTKKELKGIMIFEKKASGNGFNMECSHFYFSDNEGLLGLLDFCSSFSNYYDRVCFKAPENIRIPDILDDITLYPIERQLYFNGMVRVVNVHKVLSMAKYRGSGTIIVKILDTIIDGNNKTFKLTFRDGKSLSVSIVDEPFDVELSINDFSRFILGTHDADEIIHMSGVNINCSYEKLSQVFYKKPILITESF
ncbi:MAG: GNAT family N-acetyltransferase [Oscillospiraceae bacterium]|nr:GNAT family N-acetyltransferase [Oscillospiraceae bacterium]